MNTELKAAHRDDINIRFLFCNEVVYPTDHDFIFYWIFIFLKIFFIHTFMNPTVTQTNFCIPKHLLKDV